jgi:hypothetical protein
VSVWSYLSTGYVEVSGLVDRVTNEEILETRSAGVNFDPHASSRIGFRPCVQVGLENDLGRHGVAPAFFLLFGQAALGEMDVGLMR